MLAAIARGEYNLSKIVVLKFDGYINKNMHACSYKLNIYLPFES
jgi:hypothetical protein